MGKEAAERGEIVAKPSTARSILVSVPQHVIIPYTAPVIETPCDLRRQHKSASVSKKSGTVLPSPPATPAEAKPVPPEEPVKDIVKESNAAAKDEIKAVSGVIAVEPVKPAESAKDLAGIAATKDTDLVTPKPELKKENPDIKKPVDKIKDELVKDIVKAAEVITANPLVDKAVVAGDKIKTALTGIKVLPVTNLAATKKKSAMPAKAVTRAAKPVKKAAKATAKAKPKKKNK
jgi:hypothetical protein